MDLDSYVIIFAQTTDHKTKLFGCPADQPDIEEGDEIIEVNGRSVKNCHREFLTKYIKQCIKSRTVSLRVKRRRKNHQKVSSIEKVHDAYVIAVEDEAKKKLDQLSWTKHINVVDVATGLTDSTTNLSPSTNNNNNSGTPTTTTSEKKKDVITPTSTNNNNINKALPVITAAVTTTTVTSVPASSSTVKSVDAVTSANNSVVVTPSSLSSESGITSPTSNSEVSSEASPHNDDIVKTSCVSPAHSPPTNSSSLHVQNSPSPNSLTSEVLHPSSRNTGVVSSVATSSTSSTTTYTNTTSSTVPSSYPTTVQTKSKLRKLKKHKLSKNANNSQTPEEDYCVQKLSQHHQKHIPTAQTATQCATMPGEKKKKSSTSPHGGESTNGGEEDWVEMNGFGESVTSTKKGKGKRRSKGNSQTDSDTPAIHDYLANGSLNMSSGSHDNNHENHRYSGYSNGGNSHFDIIQDSSFDFELDDPGPHREMAIDVPDNFVASVKSPPRYPPPYSSSSTTPRSATSPARSNHKGEKSQSQDSLNSMGSGAQRPPTQQELERLHRHQEELKKRREEEARIAAEQEFLRASLRGSKKLQALENKRIQAQQHPGFINTAFDDEDDDGIGEAEERARPSSMREGVQEDRYLKKNIGVEDLFSTLHHIRSRITGPEDQKYVAFLRALFQNDQFQQAVNLHSQVIEIMSRSPPIKPESQDSSEVVTDVQYLTSQSPHNPQSQELFALLGSPELRGLLDAHDAIAQQVMRPKEESDYHGDALDFPLVQYGEDSVKIIHLQKTNEHLGATVKNEGDSVIIGRIVKGGAAEKSGLLHEGDEILEVNGIDMRGRNINDVSEMLANMSGTITFMIIPGHSTMTAEALQRSNNVMHLRALFDYDPEDDPYIPCRELGISFARGDILHAIALDDPNWWQAFREGEEEMQSLAGLIPSKSFTERRAAIYNALENKENKRKGRVCACGRKERRKKRKKKSLYNGAEDSDEVLTYEEITRYYPQPVRKRPIVLIGPSNVGRQELQQRLVDSDPDRFGAPIPHTTRPRLPGEVEGSSYHHVSQENFQNMIAQNEFVEYGKHQKNLYGTAVEAIREVKSQGKVCMLRLHPESLKVIRSSNLMPYVIFVRPPNLEKLRQLQDQLDKARPLEEVERGRVVLTDDQLKDIIDKAREMEDLYSHYFDFVLVNNDLDRAYAELLEEINRIDMEPQWVPLEWVDSL